MFHPAFPRIPFCEILSPDLLKAARHIESRVARPVKCVRNCRMLGKRKGGRDIGHPVRMILTADQNGDYTGAREDYTGARELVGDLPADARRLVADRGCDADRFRNA